jgi:hypothetical protein
MTGAFATSAIELARHNLAVIPLCGEDGKVPSINFANWRRPPGQQFIRELAGKFPDANVGILCGLSNVTIVDIDDPKLTKMMIKRCGDTPLKTATPRGGIHLWYRQNGERCSNLRTLEGLDVDIKASGGLIVAPPSVRPTGEYAGKAYTFLTGTWSDTRDLPEVRSGSVPVRDEVTASSYNPIREGSRNDALFRELLSQSRHCDNLSALLDIAHSSNEVFLPPMADTEVAKTAASAWRIEEQGRNWVGSSPHVVLTDRVHNSLIPHSKALSLYYLLKKSHGARVEPFAICSKAMSRDNVIQGWGPKGYTNARRKLIELGFLTEIHVGGSKRGDVSKYVFPKPNN